MYENFSSVLDCVSNEPVGKSEEFFGVFLVVIMEIDIEVVKVVVSFGVLF